MTPVGYADLCGVNPDRCEHPERLLILLGVETRESSSPDGIAVVDSIDDLAGQSRDSVILRFFAFCKDLCDEKKRTVVIAAPSSPFTEAHDRSAMPAGMSRMQKDLGVDRVVSYEAEGGLLLRVAPHGKVLS